MIDMNSLVGLSKEEASKKIEDLKGMVRVVAEDGESFIHTMELRSDRVNLEIEKNKVVKAWVG